MMTSKDDLVGNEDITLNNKGNMRFNLEHAMLLTPYEYNVLKKDYHELSGVAIMFERNFEKFLELAALSGKSPKPSLMNHKEKLQAYEKIGMEICDNKAIQSTDERNEHP